jgi:two-component system sensor histidine kinase CpxA
VVRNAVQYTAEDTAVEVKLECEVKRQDGDQGPDKLAAVITVRDHGAGVPESALVQIFRPFYRVDEARDREAGGVGLGLAIAERAVRLHGGSVEAANVATGGLLVTITFPLLKSAEG